MAFSLVTYAYKTDDNNSGTTLACNAGGNGGSAGQVNIASGRLIVAVASWETSTAAASMNNVSGLDWVPGTLIKNASMGEWSRAFYAIAQNDVNNFTPTLTTDVSVGYRGLVASVWSAGGTISFDDELAEGMENVATATSAGTLTVSGSNGLIVIGAKVYSTVTLSAGANFTLDYSNVYHAHAHRITSAAGEYSMEMTANAASFWTMVGMSFSEASATKNLTGGATAGATGSGTLSITTQLAVAAVARALGAGSLAVHKPLTGAAIASAVGNAALSAFSTVWRIPTNSPNGTSVHVMVLNGASPTYGIIAQGPATVAGGYVDLPGSGSAGTKAFAYVSNYNDNTAVASIRGGPSIATLTSL